MTALLPGCQNMRKPLYRSELAKKKREVYEFAEKSPP
jgi:hypothetical protein